MPRSLRGIRVVALVVTLLLDACGGTLPKFVIVFVDVSGSIAPQERERYRAAWRAITDSTALNPGDRIVLARIDASTYDGFRPVVDISIPSFNPLRDNTLDAARQQHDARVLLGSALDSALAGIASSRTAILDAFSVAPKVFGSDPRRRRIIVLSDGIEDSHFARFALSPVAEAWTESEIAQRRRGGELPDLSGDTVIVVGAVERRDVQAFWTKYVSASGGVLRAQDYGPALMNYAQ
jgi:hypothetical protein